jgi:hypothetical protein
MTVDLSTFPNHSHDGSEDCVSESELDEDPEKGLIRRFLFVPFFFRFFAKKS